RLSPHKYGDRSKDTVRFRPLHCDPYRFEIPLLVQINLRGGLTDSGRSVAGGSMLDCLLHFIAPKSRSLLLIAVLTLVAPEISRAAAIFDWASNFGPEFNSIPNGSQASSDLPGLTAAIDFGGGGDGLRVDQGSAWNGNFNPGDALLWTNSPGQ